MKLKQQKFEVWSVISVILLLVFLVFFVYPIFTLLQQAFIAEDGSCIFGMHQQLFLQQLTGCLLIICHILSFLSG